MPPTAQAVAWSRGELLILGNSGVALGYFQKGGLIVARGDAAPRAGLNQSGGDLILLGRFGALAGERQSGGRLFLPAGHTAAHVHLSARGGRLVRFSTQGNEDAGTALATGDDARIVQQALDLVARYGCPVKGAHLMNANRHERSLLSNLGLVLALVLTTLAGHGCREELGPEHFASTSLSGLVVEEKEPVRGGWIEFIPIDGALGDLRSARIGADGSFRADKVPIGSCAIRIVNAQIQTRGGGRAFQPAQLADPPRDRGGFP